MKTSRKELKMRARAALLGHYGTAVGGILLFYGISWLFMMAMELVVMVMVAVFSLAAPSEELSSLIVMGEDISGYSMAGSSLLSSGVIAAVIVGVLLYLALIMVLYLMIPGMVHLNMNICEGKKAKVTDIFWAFKHGPWKFIRLTLVIGLLILLSFLPMALLMIGGVMSGNMVFTMIFNGVCSVILIIVMMCVALNFAMLYFILVDHPEMGIIEALKESYNMMVGNRLRFLGLSFSFFGWMILGMMSCGIGMLWLTPYMGCTCIFFYQDLKPQIETIPPDTAWNSYMEEESYDMESSE